MFSRKAAFFLLFVFSCSMFAVAETAEQRVAARRAKFPVIDRARRMVESELLPQKGLENPDVIEVMKRVPRHRFIAPLHQSIAYRDQAIAIGEAQTISPPYVVAFMTEQLRPKPTDKVLEIGTGSGYQAAVLSLLVDEVYSIEIVEPLGRRAEKLLARLGMDNVKVRIGDGYKGWPEAAPFDSIIVTCSPEAVPQPLVDQLREGGRMIIPLGERYQQSFYLCRKTDGKLVREELTQAFFVPMTGQAEELRRVKPDPKNPALLGGGFEEVRENGSPIGWYYARNVDLVPYPDDFKPVPDAGVPEGKQRACFVASITDAEGSGGHSGVFQPSQILQGFPIDGREVPSVTLQFSIKGEEIVPQRRRFQTPTALLWLYDEDRNQIAEIPAGRCNGTFDWRRIALEIAVPPETREGVLLIGLPIASGRLEVDDVVLRRSEDRPSP